MFYGGGIKYRDFAYLSSPVFVVYNHARSSRIRVTKRPRQHETKMYSIVAEGGINSEHLTWEKQEIQLNSQVA